MKDAERTGDLVESRKPPAGDDDACAGSSVSGHRRKTAHPQQFVRMGIAGDGGDQNEPEDVDFAASLPAFFSVDAISFVVAAFSRRVMTLTDRIGYSTMRCRNFVK